MWELDNQLKLPEYKMPPSSVIEIPEGCDTAPAKWAVLCVAVRAAAYISKVASSGWIRCFRRGSLELESFFGNDLFDAFFLVFIYPWIPKCIGSYVTLSAV